MWLCMAFFLNDETLNAASCPAQSMVHTALTMCIDVNTCWIAGS